MKKYDAIIIGAGHNGLICAAYLAKAGKSVLVLERRHLVGGATVTEEIYPGFKYTVCSYVVSLFRPQIISDLNLPSHGFELLPLDGTLSPMLNGDYLMRWHDSGDTRRELMRHSSKDAEAYDRFGQLMYHLAMTVRPMLSTAAPSPTSLSPANLKLLRSIASEFGKKEEYLFDLAKLMTMSSADFVEQYFETPVLQGTLSASGVIGTFMGPRSPGSAYVMLHHYMGEIDGQFRAWGFPRGGMGSVAEAIASSARSFGAEIRTEAPIDQILIKNGTALGVVLEGGEEIYAKTTVSSVDPNRTFLKMIDPVHLDPEFVSQIGRFKFRGSSGKVNLSLDALPEFACLDGIRKRGESTDPYLSGGMSISPSIDYVERAYDDAKYGQFSRRPYMDIILPSMIDPSMAPPGKHVMSIFVQYAPYDLSAAGGWPANSEAFGDTVIDTLAEYIPNLKEIILHRQVVTPWDMEQTFGLTGGNIFHGELTLDQLFFLRPTPGSSGYSTPVRGLFTCGSGSHPGGGVMGAPGQLAAKEILGGAK
ncbi:MAG: NAD(P)/FAD-dependent oxidoreductase [Bacteroidetes bacterium]|nr:MAG: NAD(P)/FAD-dependent oxidoreductase [Bacteroidota bacterium]